MSVVERLVLVVSAAVFIDTMFYAVISPLLPELRHQLGLSKLSAGVMTASYPAGMLVGSLPGGALTVRTGPRFTVCAGLLMLVGSTVAFGWLNSALSLDLARFVEGVGGACSWAGGIAWIVAATPVQRRGAVIGRALAMAIGGSLFGPAIGAVASAVGRLSVRIFGMDPEPGTQLAHHLGRALQFTNILRDLDEDAAVGRLYLPSEALGAAGISAREPAAILADPQLDRACRWLAAKALEEYHAADKIIRSGPKGRLRAPRLMIGVYRHILKRMIRASWKSPRERISVGKGRLAWVVLTRGIPK